jgi:hypothetical protein
MSRMPEFAALIHTEKARAGVETMFGQKLIQNFMRRSFGHSKEDKGVTSFGISNQKVGIEPIDGSDNARSTFLWSILFGGGAHESKVGMKMGSQKKFASREGRFHGGAFGICILTDLTVPKRMSRRYKLGRNASTVFNDSVELSKTRMSKTLMPQFGG